MDLSFEETNLVKTLYLYKIDNINDEFLANFDRFFKKIDYFINVYYSDYLDFRSKSKNFLYKLL